jgi:hypothetical protein
MRRDTRFARPERSELEGRLPSGTLSVPQAMGVWNMMLQADDPSEVCRWYRTYRDSDHCTLPREQLRAMRDTMITAMRESNRQDPKRRTEKRKGTHYPNYETEWHTSERKGA